MEEGAAPRERDPPHRPTPTGWAGRRHTITPGRGRPLCRPSPGFRVEARGRETTPGGGGRNERGRKEGGARRVRACGGGDGQGVCPAGARGRGSRGGEGRPGRRWPRVGACKGDGLRGEGFRGVKAQRGDAAGILRGPRGWGWGRAVGGRGRAVGAPAGRYLWRAPRWSCPCLWCRGCPRNGSAPWR